MCDCIHYSGSTDCPLHYAQAQRDTIDLSTHAVRMVQNGVHLIHLIHSTDSIQNYTQHDTILPFEKFVLNGRKWCPFDRFESYVFKWDMAS